MVRCLVDNYLNCINVINVIRIINSENVKFIVVSIKYVKWNVLYSFKNILKC